MMATVIHLSNYTGASLVGSTTDDNNNMIDTRSNMSMSLVSSLSGASSHNQDASLHIFTRAEIAQVRDACGETNPNMEQTLVKGFNIEITRRHLTTFADSELLGDEVINFYKELLQEREMNAMTRENRTRQVWFTNTFFISKFSENGYTYRNER